MLGFPMFTRIFTLLRWLPARASHDQPARSLPLSRFRATVSPHALEKAPYLFNSSDMDVVVELFQNARRSGATRIDVRTKDSEGRRFVTIRDNGTGIDNPKSLLTLGGSGWNRTVQDAENPAGMGFFALSSRPVTVASRSARHANGWVIDLEPDHFRGIKDVVVRRADVEAGTTISFKPTMLPFDGVVAAAARYCPVPVYFNGERVEQKSFLEDAVRIEEWRGLRIGVLPGLGSWSEKVPNMNFHGVTMKAGLPRLDTVVMEDDRYSVRVDIVDCPELKLVLPARKEVVENAFLSELREEIERILFRVLQDQGRHSLSFSSWCRARALGVDLPEAEACLRPFVASARDRDFYSTVEEYAAVPGSVLIVNEFFEVPDEICLERALKLSGFTMAPCRLERSFEGYSWYDAIPKLNKVTWQAVYYGAGHIDIDPTQTWAGDRPDELVATFHIVGKDQETTTHDLQTDLLFTGEACGYLDEIGPLVTTLTELDPSELQDLLTKAYFAHSDDVNDDSWQTQFDRFAEESLHLSYCLLVSKDEAKQATLVANIQQHIAWRLPVDRKTVIVVDSGNVSITYGEPGAAD